LNLLIGADLSIVPIILLGYLFNGFYVIFTAGIYIEEKSIYAPFITGAGAILNIAANFLLIPILGMIGAALATLLSYLVMAAGLYFVTQKFYRIEYEISKIFKIFLIIFLVGSVYYYLLFNNELLLIYKIFLLIFFIASMFIFIIDKKEKEYLKSLRRRGTKM
jgi:O-antigen/teichoic acid export membrane protein